MFGLVAICFGALDHEGLLESTNGACFDLHLLKSFFMDGKIQVQQFRR